MSYTIAVAGKGGTGKTTISSLVIRHFVRAGKTPVFAVDADSNFNLNDQLGVAVAVDDRRLARGDEAQDQRERGAGRA